MPRRRKPPGYEKWTWAEIDAGRRMSKSEKRWNLIAKELNWEQRPNGSFQAPPQAVPFLVIMLVLMLVLAVLAPHGLNNAKGEEGAIAVLVFLGLIGTMVLLVVFGRNEPGSASGGRSSDPVPLTSATPSLPRSPARPILRPLLGAIARPVGRFLSFRWVSTLPDWLQPIVWALVITSPVVAAFVRWRSGGSLAGDLAFCLAFVASGCALGGLIHDGLRAHRLRREHEKAERAAERDRFRAILAHELRNRAVRPFDFSALVAQHGIPRFEADAAAAIIYRRFSDKVVEDGVITAEERRRMDALARLLEINPERVAVIEAAAKSDRFQVAVSEVLADGIVTADEAADLEALRDSLEIGAADWQAGQDRISAVEVNFGVSARSSQPPAPAGGPHAIRRSRGPWPALRPSNRPRADRPRAWRVQHALVPAPGAGPGHAGPREGTSREPGGFLGCRAGLGTLSSSEP